MENAKEANNRSKRMKSQAAFLNNNSNVGFSLSPPPIQRKEENEKPGILGSLWSNFTNIAGNNALGSVIGEVADGAGGNMASRTSRFLSQFNGNLDAGVMSRIANGSHDTIESARSSSLFSEGIRGRMGLMDTAESIGKYLPLLGLYTDGTGLYDSIAGEGSAKDAGGFERAYNGIGSGLGLTSSVIGSLGLAGGGLSAMGGSSLLGGTALGGWLSAGGAGLTGAVGTGTTLGAVGAAAGSLSGLLAAGALGWGAGSLINEYSSSDEAAEDYWGQLDEVLGWGERGTLADWTDDVTTWNDVDSAGDVGRKALKGLGLAGVGVVGGLGAAFTGLGSAAGDVWDWATE